MPTSGGGGGGNAGGEVQFIITPVCACSSTPTHPPQVLLRGQDMGSPGYQDEPEAEHLSERAMM